MKSFFILLIGVFGISCVYGQKQFEIRYLGNMGIAITHDDSTILIDGLHDFYGDDYLPTDTSALGSMLRKQKPFSKIIAIAVTHRHGDHFDENLVASVAKLHPAALLIGGSQTRSLLNTDMQKRFSQVIETAVFHISSNLSIHAMKIPHTYAQRHSTVENYRVEIIWNGFRIVHVGDADEKEEAITSLKEKPAVMVVPAWYFSKNGIELMNKVKPARILVTHISPADKTIYKNEKLEGEIISFRKHGEMFKL